MANVVITLKILPESPDVDLDQLYEKILPLLKEVGVIIAEDSDDNLVRKEIEPIAFGLKALNLRFLYPESKGNPDIIEEKVKELDGVSEAQIIDVRRAFG